MVQVCFWFLPYAGLLVGKKWIGVCFVEVENRKLESGRILGIHATLSPECCRSCYLYKRR